MAFLSRTGFGSFRGGGALGDGVELIDGVAVGGGTSIGGASRIVRCAIVILTHINSMTTGIIVLVVVEHHFRIFRTYMVAS